MLLLSAILPRIRLISSSLKRILTLSANCICKFSIISESSTSVLSCSASGRVLLARAAFPRISIIRVLSSLCRTTPSSTRATILSSSTRCAQTDPEPIVNASPKPIVDKKRTRVKASCRIGAVSLALDLLIIILSKPTYTIA